MFDFNTDHKALVWTMFSVFLFLTLGVAVFPAFQMQDNYGPLPDQPKMTAKEIKGQDVFIAEGCVACHTQQVRNIEMDEMWGKRPSMPEDFYYNKQRMDIWRQTPSILGSERTGPDLTNVGNRQPLDSWQLLHLYEPRAVSPHSVMPSFRWLFDEMDSAFIDSTDVVVSVPKKYMNDTTKKVVATQRAMQLVAYLESLKQPKLPEGEEAPKFIPLLKKENKTAGGGGGAAQSSGPDGKTLYMNNCSACHQATGKGVPGAFPALAGSGIVNNPDAGTMIKIALEGYDNLPEYGPMPGLGDQLSDAEIAAILSYERHSWGNDAPPVKEEDVKTVRDHLKENQ